MSVAFARIDRQRGVVCLSMKAWGETFAPELLPRRIRFYEQMSKRQPGRYGEGYRAVLGELRRIRKALEERPL